MAKGKQKKLEPEWVMAKSFLAELLEDLPYDDEFAKVIRDAEFDPTSVNLALCLTLTSHKEGEMFAPFVYGIIAGCCLMMSDPKRVYAFLGSDNKKAKK